MKNAAVKAKATTKETYVVNFVLLQDNGYWTAKTEKVTVNVVKEKCNHGKAVKTLEDKYSGKELYVNSVVYV